MTLQTGLKPRMVALRFIHLRTTLPVGQRWRMISLDVCTVVLATISGWEEQIQMTREIGGGLTEPHSISQVGKVVRVLMVFKIAVLQCITTITITTTPIDGMTTSVTHRTHTFVKLILTNKEWTLSGVGAKTDMILSRC